MAETRSLRVALFADGAAFRDFFKRTYGPTIAVYRSLADDPDRTAELDVALNAVGVELNGTAIETLRKAPGVSFVEAQGVFTPQAHEDPQLAVIASRARVARRVTREPLTRGEAGCMAAA